MRVIAKGDIASFQPALAFYEDLTRAVDHDFANVVIIQQGGNGPKPGNFVGKLLHDAQSVLPADHQAAFV